jgi:cytochrome c peroxidase
VLLPIADPDEMGLPVASAVERLAADASYAGAFADAYGGAPSADALAKALASFVRGLLLADSPADRFVFGETTVLSREERAGMWVYESKGACWRCHPRPLFTDEELHNTGVGARGGEPEPGRAEVTGDTADAGKFKTPTLRGLRFTAPYMHDGSLATLEDVVAFYRRGGNANRNLSPLIAPLDLTDEDAGNLVAFLRALSRAASGTPPAR